MLLKFFPDDVDLGELTEMTVRMTQTALLRAYEILERDRRPLTESERQALDVMIRSFGLAKRDAQKFKKRLAN